MRRHLWQPFSTTPGAGAELRLFEGISRGSSSELEYQDVWPRQDQEVAPIASGIQEDHPRHGRCSITKLSAQ